MTVVKSFIISSPKNSNSQTTVNPYLFAFLPFLKAFSPLIHRLISISSFHFFSSSHLKFSASLTTRLKLLISRRKLSEKMALRPLDNALPITSERPKKQAKISITAHKEKQQPDLGINDENKAPLPPTAGAEASIDYISSDNLKPFQDPNSKIEGLFGGLESKDWLRVWESLNDVRRFALYHSDLLQPILEKVLLVMVKSIKNPRSALCKTSIMASSDIFIAFGENLLESASDAFSQLLLQLLLKASQDKKFVCEEADKALLSMVKSMAPLSILQKLSAYSGHSNPRVRAKAAVSISNCVSKMDLKNMEEFGLASLIQMASKLLNDKLPEAREAARGFVVSLHRAITENEDEEEFWKNFCQSNLPAIHAQAMIKLVSS